MGQRRGELAVRMLEAQRGTLYGAGAGLTRHQTQQAIQQLDSKRLLFDEYPAFFRLFS